MKQALEHDENSVLAQMREQIAATPMPTAYRRRLTGLLTGRPRMLAGAGAGIATATAAVVLALAGVSSSPAFAVTTAANGNVTITLNALSAVDALNAKLVAAGVHVRVAEVKPSCNAPVQVVGSSAPPTTLQATPGAGASNIQLSSVAPQASAQGLTDIPAGQTLVLAASQSGLQTVGQIAQTTAPTCVAPRP